MAFDPAAGRIWIVCPHCRRWNLVPLENPWPTVAAADDLFRATAQRVSNEVIGLAVVDGGTQLIRVGSAPAGEYAAWRYGQFIARRRRAGLIGAAAGATIASSVMAGAAVLAESLLPVAGILPRVFEAVRGTGQAIVAQLQSEQIGVLRVRERHLLRTAIVPGAGGSLGLDLWFDGGRCRLEGSSAEIALLALMPHVNRFSGTRRTIRSALAAIEAAGGPAGFLRAIAAAPATGFRWLDPDHWRHRHDYLAGGIAPGSPLTLTRPLRLAVEIALNEELERRAATGDLATVERAWREAEAVARIADSL